MKTFYTIIMYVTVFYFFLDIALGLIPKIRLRPKQITLWRVCCASTPWLIPEQNQRRPQKLLKGGVFADIRAESVDRYTAWTVPSPFIETHKIKRQTKVFYDEASQCFRSEEDLEKKIPYLPLAYFNPDGTITLVEQ